MRNPLSELNRLTVLAPAPIQVGDVLSYGGVAFKVWGILNLSVALYPEQAPGLFLMLKGAGMHRHSYFVVPIRDVEQPQMLAA